MSDDSLRKMVLTMRKQAAGMVKQCDDVLDLMNHIGVDTASRTQHVCPECGITSSSHRKMAEHRYYTHDAEEPAHFALIEARSNDPQTPDEAPVPGARKAES